MLQKRLKRGEATPALENKPILTPVSHSLLDLFTTLSATRTPGEPIKLTEISALLDLRGVYDLEIRQHLAETLVAIDWRWMKHARRTSSKGKD